MEMSRSSWLAVFVASLFVAPAAVAITLEEELSFLLSTHPELREVDERVSASVQGVNSARAAFLPQVEIIGSRGYERIDDTQPNDISSLPPTTGRVTLTQSLFSGGRNTGDFRIAGLNEDLTEIDRDFRTQRLLFDATSAYLDILRNAESLRLANENVSTIQRQLELEDERVRRGSGIAVDVLLAKSRLQIAKQNSTIFDGALREAMARYERVIGRRPEVAALEPPTVPAAVTPKSVKDAIDIAVRDNLTLRGVLTELQIADQRETVAKADLFPDLDLVSKANFERNFDGTRGVRRDYSVVARVTWKLFSGLRTTSNVKAAKFERAAVRQRNVDTRRQVDEDVSRSWEALQTSILRFDLLTNAVDLAAELFEVRARLRDQGRETETNVLDAQQELFLAQIELVGAEFDAYVSRYRLLFAVGLLTPQNLGVESESPKTTE